MKAQEMKDGQWAVITGASSGIGYELAKIFAKKGFNLVVAAEDSGIADASNAFRQWGVEVRTVQTDLATYDGVEKLYTEIQALGTPIDSICLNAGVGLGGAFLDTDLQKELKIIRLNIDSLIHLTKRVLPDLVAAGRGRILFTSSLVAEGPAPYLSVYAGTKAFVQSFAEAIRFETKDSGVTVTALQPGATETNFFDRAEMQNTKVAQSKKDDPAKVAQDGYDALMDGKDHVVGGSFKNKVQATLSKLIPQPAAAAASGKDSKPGSASR